MHSTDTEGVPYCDRGGATVSAKILLVDSKKYANGKLFVVDGLVALCANRSSFLDGAFRTLFFSFPFLSCRGATLDIPVAFQHAIHSCHSYSLEVCPVADVILVLELAISKSRLLKGVWTCFYHRLVLSFIQETRSWNFNICNALPAYIFQSPKLGTFDFSKFPILVFVFTFF